MNTPNKVTVIGAGLAGCECALALAGQGIETSLVDMKPEKLSPAHSDGNFAEIVCSNSLKNDSLLTASGLLKEEMRRLNSFIIKTADSCRVPAGAALAVNRGDFAAKMTALVKAEPLIRVSAREEDSLFGDGIRVIATGPLTSGGLYSDIKEKLGALYFYDAAAPIVTAESIDMQNAFTGSRYGKGGDDYINCPMTESEYSVFLKALLAAERVPLKEFENEKVFEGCMPVEVMARRGSDTLRFGTLKPVGLYDGNGKRPYAVLQLRKEDTQGSAYNLVGFQTNLTYAAQREVFTLIPALKNAEFVKYGVMHRNTYVNAPRFLDGYRLKGSDVYFAGQISGVEGYVESAASGLTVALQIAASLKGKSFMPDAKTVIGALYSYLKSAQPDNFLPMNANYAIVEPIEYSGRDKDEKKRLIAERSLNLIASYAREFAL